MENYIERKEYNNVITIKLVIPGGCNANCPFCYNKDKHIRYNKKEFIKNFLTSLDNIITEIGDKNPISVDITGGEPTLDIDYLKTVLTMLKGYNIKSRVLRTTLTTNGYNLLPIIPYLKDVIDYVNISVHDYNEERRFETMNMRLSESNYSELIKELNKVGIDVSASAVIFQKQPNFESWRDEFIKWAKCLGFKALRFRCDVFWEDGELFDKYLLNSKEDKRFDVITYEKTTDSHWLRLREKESGFRVFYLHGVLDTSILTKGIEYVIDDDGKCYCDYYKRVKIEDYTYEIGKIYDKVDYGTSCNDITEKNEIMKVSYNRNYCIYTKNYGKFIGKLINYNCGNVVLLTKKGICHFPYRETEVMFPIGN